MKENPNQFEDALKRLEEIVGLLEGDESSLEEGLKRYEEGIKLVRFCSKKLQEAEKKIEVLSRDEEGRVVKKNFSDRVKNASSKKSKGEVSEEGLLF